MHACDLNLRTHLHCSRRILTFATACACAVTSSTNAFSGVGCHHAPLLPRSNPHSAPGTTACHFPRFRSLEAFGRRPPASVFAGPSVIGRHPKPFTRAALQTACPPRTIYPPLRKVDALRGALGSSTPTSGPTRAVAGMVGSCQLRRNCPRLLFASCQLWVMGRKARYSALD
jgi:hypothetical protein